MLPVITWLHSNNSELAIKRHKCCTNCTITNAKNSTAIDIKIKKKLHASACNLKKNNCEKKQLKIYLLPQVKMREKRYLIFEIKLFQMPHFIHLLKGIKVFMSIIL